MSSFLKHLHDAEIEPKLIYHDKGSQPELRFSHEFFGEVTFPDISQYEHDQLVEELEHIHQKKSEAENDDSIFENNRVG